MNPRDILVLGNGYIGKLAAKGLCCKTSSARIYNLKNALRILDRYKPKILINAIGQTGRRNVDDCEKIPDETLMANTFIPIILAEACLRKNIKLIHISSGCIFNYNFDNDHPISERQLPLFFDLFYSRTKIYSEQALELLSRKRDILIIRIRIPLDDKPHPKNLLDKLLRFNGIVDVPNSVTYIPDMIAALKHLIRIRATGIYNIANKGGLRYPQLLDIYKKHVPGFSYKIIDYRKLPTPRTNLILSTRKLERSGFAVRPIKQVLEQCVKNYLHSS